MGGIPDICTRKKNKGYEGSYFDMYNYNKCEEVKQFLLEIKCKLENIGYKVFFVIITTMSLQQWNQRRLHIGKTSYLIHQNSYQEMQEKLNSTIREINQFIARINEKSQMLTLFLHTYVHKISKKKIDTCIQT